MCNGRGTVTVYSETMTSNALGWLADSRWMMLHMHQPAAGGRHGRHPESMTSSTIRLRQSNAYLLE